MTLRALSYLAPSVPAVLFEAIARHVGEGLGTHVELRFDDRRSGPRPGDDQAFRSGEVDLAFLCATSYVWLTDVADPAISHIGVGWVPDDPRAAGRPVYFADVLAARSGPDRLADLAGHRVAYNDEVSLSGLHSLRMALVAAGVDPGDVRFVRSGSHLRSLDWLCEGRVTAASVDSTVWSRRRRETPRRHQQLRRIDALGPHPVQPIVVRAGLGATRTVIREALLTAGKETALRRALRQAGLIRFAPVDLTDLDVLRGDLGVLGHADPAVRAY